MPDWREPFPDLPFPPKGRCASAPLVELFTETIPARHALAEAEGRFRIVRVDRRRQPVPVAVGELHRLVEVGERGHADDRAERLRRVDLVLGRDAVDDRRVAVDASVRVAHEPVPRVVARDAAGAGGARHVVVLADQAEPVLEALGEALVDHRPVQHLLGRVAYRRLLDRAREAAHELVVDRLVHDHRAERRTALPGRAEAAEERALDREVESRPPASPRAGSCRPARGRPPARGGR